MPRLAQYVHLPVVLALPEVADRPGGRQHIVLPSDAQGRRVHPLCHDVRVPIAVTRIPRVAATVTTIATITAVDIVGGGVASIVASIVDIVDIVGVVGVVVVCVT